MTDTQELGSQSAVEVNNVLVAGEPPQIELAGNQWVYPIVEEQGGRKKHIHFHMRPYAARALREVLKESSAVFQEEGPEYEIQSRSTVAQQEFVSQHLLHISNVADKTGKEVSDSIKEQLLESNPQLLNKTFTTGICGIFIEEREEEEAETDAFVVVSEDGGVPSNVELIGEDGLSYLVEMSHDLRNPTELERRTYARAQKTRVRMRKGQFRMMTDLNVLGSLYDSLIKRISNCMFKGAYCEKDNKADWLGAVPFFWKVVVVNEVFRRVRVKN